MTSSPTAGPSPTGAGLPAFSHGTFQSRAVSRLDRAAPGVFILPAVIVILALSIFPLIVSLYLSLAKFSLGPGGFTFTFVGLRNYDKLLFGSQQFHFLGVLQPLGLIG